MQLIDALDLDRNVADIEKNFSFAVEKMPAIPRPLPKSYQHIRGENMLMEAAAAAPMNGASPQATSPTQRQLQRLAVWYAQATEYATIHKVQKQLMERSKSRLQIGALVVSTAVAIALLVTPEKAQKTMGVLAGVISACVGLANSWLKFAAYETLEVEHEEACTRFNDVAFDIDVMFTQLFQLSKKGDPAKLIDMVSCGKTASSSNSAVGAPDIGSESSAETAIEDADVKEALADTNMFDIDASTQLTPMVKAQPPLKLQLWLRQSFELRMAHSLVFDQLSDEKDAINFVLLVIATTNSVILMLGSSAWILQMAAIISALVTALTGVTRFKDYDHKLRANMLAARSFTSSEGKITKLLVAHPVDEYDDHVSDVAAVLDAAMRSAPVLPSLKKFKAENGRPLFEFITTDARWKETKTMYTAMHTLAIGS